MKELKVGKDYIDSYDSNFIVIDRTGDTENRGFYGNNFEHDLFCLSPDELREATEEEVIEVFRRHLIHRYGKDWQTMKIKERHPYSSLEINNGSCEVEICKCYDGWNVWNKNGMLYHNGIWVERLEEKELEKIHIKDAITVNTVIHCETEEEAERILNMAHELGYKWCTREGYKNKTLWRDYREKTCYNIFDGIFGYVKFYEGYKQIIPSTQIADLEEVKSTDWTPAPTDIEAMNKKALKKLPINKVTTRNLDIALRIVGIQLDVNIINKIIDLVELIENEGDDVTIKDIVSLQQTW